MSIHFFLPGKASKIRLVEFIKKSRVMPFNTTAAAKVILAYQRKEMIKKLVVLKNMVKSAKKSIVDPNLFIEHLKKIKEEGYSICKEEMEEGVMAVAAPIWDIKPRVVGSVAVVGPMNRIENLEQDFVKNIKKTAYLISREMGYNPEKLKMYSIF